MSDEFSVVEFYDNGRHAYVARGLGPRAAVFLAKGVVDIAEDDDPDPNRLVTVKVIITDGGDFTVFSWERGKGVVFPGSARPDDDR
jgi:hypothetical protein